jgi:hypothetical protein
MSIQPVILVAHFKAVQNLPGSPNRVYVKCWTTSDRNPQKTSIRQTAGVAQAVWDEKKEFMVEHPDRDFLFIEVKNEGTWMKSIIGRVRIPCVDVQQSNVEAWYTVKGDGNTNAGNICLGLQVRPKPGTAANAYSMPPAPSTNQLPYDRQNPVAEGSFFVAASTAPTASYPPQELHGSLGSAPMLPATPTAPFIPSPTLSPEEVKAAKLPPGYGQARNDAVNAITVSPDSPPVIEATAFPDPASAAPPPGNGASISGPQNSYYQMPQTMPQPVPQSGMTANSIFFSQQQQYMPTPMPTPMPMPTSTFIQIGTVPQQSTTGSRFVAQTHHSNVGGAVSMNPAYISQTVYQQTPPMAVYPPQVPTQMSPQMSPQMIPQVPLPDWWEERRTPDGRVYFVNHRDQITQWTRPM